MPQVIAIPIATALVSAGIGSVAAGVIGNVVATVAFSAASSLITKAIAGKPSAPEVNAPTVRGSVKQATPGQRLAIGETRIGGPMWFYKVVPPYLYLGHAYSAMPITEFLRLYIGDVQVPIDSSGQPTAAPYFTGAAKRLTVDFQDGSSLAQVRNPLIAADFSATTDADFRHPGIPVCVFKCDYGASFDEFQSLWGQAPIPDAQWVVRGAPMYDPRDPAQILPTDLNDPEDLWNAVATWKYSNTAALVQAHWAMMPYGLNAGLDRIRWDTVAAAADFDDESVPLKGGGVQKRHTIDGVAPLDENPLPIMEAMLTANRGFMTTRGGSIGVHSSQPVEPVITITDSDIVGRFNYRDRQPKRDLANVATFTFISPERKYQPAEGPEIRRADLIASDGETLKAPLNWPYTNTHQRGQRLTKAELAQGRLGRAITGDFGMRVLGLTEGMVCRFWSETYPEANGTYQVRTWELPQSLQAISLQLSEYDPDIPRDWTASTDEQDFELTVEEV